MGKQMKRGVKYGKTDEKRCDVFFHYEVQKMKKPFISFGMSAIISYSINNGTSIEHG